LKIKVTIAASWRLQATTLALQYLDAITIVGAYLRRCPTVSDKKVTTFSLTRFFAKTGMGLGRAFECGIIA